MPTLFVTLSTLLLHCVFSSAALGAESNTQHFYRDNVLGSSMQLTVDAVDTEAKLAEHAVLAEIKRLEKVFSGYDKTSEVSLLTSANKKPSKELVAVVKLCEQWQDKAPKAFSCRLGDVIQAWQGYVKQQSRPDRKAIRAIARRAVNSAYSLSDLMAAKANPDFSWDFGAIAKGYILDQALLIARQVAPNARAIGIDIGGDGVYWQSSNDAKPWRIALADPAIIDDSQQQILGYLDIQHGAVAFSGHRSRARKIGRRSYSHILTPRDGWPRELATSAIVKAATATQADAAATALAAMDVSAGLDWANAQDDIAALLVSDDGRHYATDNWYHNFVADKKYQSTVQANITFALPKPKTGQYRKPYVALWLENRERKVIRNLLLLGDSERWMSENSLWWRRQGRKETQLLQGFARPTRRAGEYQVSWQGRDDFGQLLGAGDYVLTLEVSREHGGHEKISIPFELGNENNKFTKEGKEEIRFLTLELSSTQLDFAL